MAHEMVHFAQYCWSKGANLFVSQKGSSAATPDGLTYPLGTGPTQTQTRFARRSGRLHKAAISNRLRSDKPHIVRAGSRRSHVSREQDRIGWNSLHTSDDWDVGASPPAKPRRI